jgi:hypothetical protein
MTGNANFTTPIPTLASVTTAADALEAKQEAMDGTEIKTYERNVAEAVLDDLVSKLQGYVDAVSGKDAGKVLSAGFEVRNPRTKAVILPAPQGLQADMTKIDGQIKLKFQTVKKKLYYRVEVALDFPGMLNWTIAAESTKSTVYINDLNPGQRYHIRVYTVNTAGASPASEEVICRTFQY